MKKEQIVVLAEGSCPFLDGPEYSCCLMSIAMFR
jgi:hypothetical protein